MGKLRGVVKDYDPATTAVVTAVLEKLGGVPQKLSCSVSLHDGSKLEPPLIAFSLEESDMMNVRSVLSKAGIEVLTIQDPVESHAYSEDRNDDRYVVVKWLPPMDRALAIVDVTQTQFVSMLNLEKFPIERANADLVEEICKALQLAANEMNRLDLRRKVHA